MPHKIGFVANTGGKLAHQNMLEEVMNFATSNGWTLMRFANSSGDEHELILKAPGLTGIEEIYVGLQTYQNDNADYYNLLAASFTGYVPSLEFHRQPGFMSSGVPAHNRRIDYWLTLNGQRLVLVMKVGTPVYESCYLGKMLPYARPKQYPYPVICGGMLDGKKPTRFSDTTHSAWVKGSTDTAGTNKPNMRLHFNSGAWVQPQCWPWNNDNLSKSRQIRDSGGVQPLLPITLSNKVSGIFGDLDGVFYVSGFDNAVENTIEVAGKSYIVFQDVGRTGFSDYYAVRMDT